MNEPKSIIVTGRKIPISEATRRLNPHLFQPVGGLGTPQPEPDKVRALDRKPSPLKGRKRGVVVVVAFVPVLLRATDEDNCGSSQYKSMRDSIARCFGVDDADPRIKWEYHPPIITNGCPGTQVLVTLKQL